MSYLQFSRFPLFSQRLEAVRPWICADTAFGHKAASAVQRVEEAHNAAELLEAVNILQRVYVIGMLKVQDNPDIVALIDDPKLHTWKDFKVLPATPAQQDILAELMYGGDPQRRTPILLTVNEYGRGVAELIVQKCIDKGAEFDPWVNDQRFLRTILSLLDDTAIAAYGELMASRRENVQRTISMETDQSLSADILVDPLRIKLYNNAAEARAQKRTRNLFFTSTRLPTPAGAMIDGMGYQEYVDLFFRMVAVDWNKVNEAHLILIHKLNAGKTLRITNNDGTDLTMDIDGFSFANSLVAKNVPGSEVFSAPRRDGTNGIIVAKGKFAEKVTSKIIENITLEIKDGRIVSYHADSGMEYLIQAIETDEGSHYLGEIGIGTNPALKRHIINSLMVEKIGGSFHVAVGAAYEFKDYLGTPVHLDNGNRSKIHWDITTMLYGKEGRMIVDDEIIMEAGLFVDLRLSYLNGGRNLNTCNCVKG